MQLLAALLVLVATATFGGAAILSDRVAKLEAHEKVYQDNLSLLNERALRDQRPSMVDTPVRRSEFHI